MCSTKLSRFKRLIATTLAAALTMTALGGCSGDEKPADDINTKLDLKTPVSLILAGRNAETWPALESMISKFEMKYPNCSITYEFVQGTDDVIKTRLGSETDKVDIFTTSNIQSDSLFLDCAYDLLTEENALNLADTNEGIVDNFRYLKDTSKLYAIPYGGEMRGLYVNKTLLKKFNLEIPTSRTELLNCCEVLYNNGYIPFQSASANFAQQLLYPSICNRIVNGGDYKATYDKMEEIYDGISEFFRDEYTFLYDIVEKGYYDYKRAQDLYGYTFSGSDGKALDFLNVVKNDANEFEKKDDVGTIAFMTETQAFMLYLDQSKADYHSEIEYEFILAPVGSDGGYAYLSPSTGLAVNKNSNNLDWAMEFMNFLFTAENSKEFAALQGCIPNTADALLQYNVPENRISTVGQCTFSYSFYKTVITLLCEGYKDEEAPENDMVGISKMNAKKYMNVEYTAADEAYLAANPNDDYFCKDGEEYVAATDEYKAANPDAQLYAAKYSIIYSLEDYMKRLESEFQKIKLAR